MKEIRIVKAKVTTKRPYVRPKITDFGKVADLTRKPGSRIDGNAGTKGDKGVGS